MNLCSSHNPYPIEPHWKYHCLPWLLKWSCNHVLYTSKKLLPLFFFNANASAMYSSCKRIKKSTFRMTKLNTHNCATSCLKLLGVRASKVSLFISQNLPSHFSLGPCIKFWPSTVILREIQFNWVSADKNS